MSTFRLKPIIVETRDTHGFASQVADPKGASHAKAANDNRRPPRELLRLTLNKTLYVLPPLIAAALIIYVMMS